MRVEELVPFAQEILLNGCGARDGIHVDLIFLRACLQHDLNYLTGGDEFARDAYDIEFHRDMIDIIDELPWYRFLGKWLYRRTAWLYYELVVRFGEDSFEYRDPDVDVTVELLLEEEEHRQHHNITRRSPLTQCLECA